MNEERYLHIFLTQNELCPNIKKIILNKLKQKYLYREIGGKMITDIQINDFNNMPLSNNLEINILANVTYKIYKLGDIINGEIFLNGRDNKILVISYDIICEILNIDDIDIIKDKYNVDVMLTDVKSTNGCIYFLAQGNIINIK